MGAAGFGFSFGFGFGFTPGVDEIGLTAGAPAATTDVPDGVDGVDVCDEPGCGAVCCCSNAGAVAPGAVGAAVAAGGVVQRLMIAGT